MTPSITRILLATGCILGAATAQAATLGLATGATILSGSGEVFYVPGTDLSFGGTGDAGDDISAVAALDEAGQLAAGIDPGAILAGSGFAGTITALGFEIGADTDGGDTIELRVTVDADPDGLFGSEALAILTGEFGTTDAFAATEFSGPATLAISPLTAPAPVPLPAGGLLLLSGLAFLALRRSA